ncbi:2'-5' RNA ligase family protein [Curtobacterium flaccumfaciens pv. flaccumfaciens]|uniref:2'-5' RNA ligase family protein n=1 Tax=Curtobacterium flaccumfaciens pv. flaccumfaciens TaxID=138532 RepID=A0A9Q2W2N4_9MICO|nr:2'-5' RNA ligase family protein [Curtobacterium flaccumfaciens]MBT1540436.1 2'-5' RNA ligase family protein [Curtobacterium flaccumfaciens pv. flaccumfaciens]
MRSIELVLGPESDAAVRSAWQALIDADLPSLGRHPSPSNAPHVTLAAGETLPLPAGFRVSVPTSIRLGGLLLFPAGAGRSVLVRAVVLDTALTTFHDEVHAIAPGGVETSVPGHWSPHVTLARRVRDEDLPRAVAALRAVPLPETLDVGGVRHWDGERRTITPLAFTSI